jgi:hypothetical protein
VTEVQARRIANAIVASAGVALAFVVLTNPRLRRMAMGAVFTWLGGQNVGAYLATQAGRAWAESGRDIMAR